MLEAQDILESKEDRTMAKLKPIISITLISILSIAISPSILQSASPQRDDHCCVPVLLAPIVVSGANIYIQHGQMLLP
jgi:hypothetical protein